jgi:hypothetical protein
MLVGSGIAMTSSSSPTEKSSSLVRLMLELQSKLIETLKESFYEFHSLSPEKVALQLPYNG